MYEMVNHLNDWESFPKLTESFGEQQSFRETAKYMLQVRNSEMLRMLRALAFALCSPKLFQIGSYVKHEIFQCNAKT